MTNKGDELTGLKSADQFKNKVEQYMDYSSVASPYALLILDVANFKQVNEQYGHMFGDNVLVQVADTLIENINPGDYAGRLGGDEFVVFLKNVGEDAVNNMCDRICRQIRNIYVGENITIDASIGAVVASDPSLEYKSLLQTADIALGYLSEEGKTGIRILNEIAAREDEMKFSAIYERDFKSSATKEKRLSELIFDLLEQAKDIDKAINAVLALVGEKRKVSTINVLSYTEDSFELMHRWAARGVQCPEQIEGGPFIRKYIDEHRENIDNHPYSVGMGLIDENTIQGLSLREVNALLPMGAKSVVYSEIMENGEYTGIVVFADCTGERVWDEKDFKGFKTVSRLIGAFTVKGKAIKAQKENK